MPDITSAGVSARSSEGIASMRACRLVSLSAYLPLAIASALRAGAAILDVYGTDFGVETKDDKSPLTEADRRSHEVISTDLKSTGLPILSEEGKDIPYEERKNWE